MSEACQSSSVRNACTGEEPWYSDRSVVAQRRAIGGSSAISWDSAGADYRLLVPTMPPTGKAIPDRPREIVNCPRFADPVERALGRRGHVGLAACGDCWRGAAGLWRSTRASPARRAHQQSRISRSRARRELRYQIARLSASIERMREGPGGVRPYVSKNPPPDHALARDRRRRRNA